MLTSTPRQQCGVSIVEILIGIAIVAILLVQGIPAFRSWMQSTEIRTAAESILNGLQLTRAEAVKNNALVRFTLGTGATWTVGCVNTDRDGDGVVDCPALIQGRSATEGTPNADIAPQEVVAATGVAATTPVFVGNITFNGLGRVVTSGTSASLSAGTNAIYAVSNPGGGTCATSGGPMRCLRVVVTSGGQIRMCDPMLNAASDPRGC